MPGYRCARALDRLLGEINAVAPRRDTRSDGWIGDTNHRAAGFNASDHNPWVRLGSTGIVTARDFDHDPGRGADMAKIAEAIRAKRDRRVKYIIFRGRICRSYPAHGLGAWVWGPYSGPNAHTAHLHVSVRPEREYFDDAASWGLAKPPAPKTGPVRAAPLTDRRRPVPRRTLTLGDEGEDVRFVQRYIGGTRPDGVYGPDTEVAVKAYQRMRGIRADGVVGPATWAQITGAQ